MEWVHNKLISCFPGKVLLCQLKMDERIKDKRRARTTRLSSRNPSLPHWWPGKWVPLWIDQTPTHCKSSSQLLGKDSGPTSANVNSFLLPKAENGSMEVLPTALSCICGQATFKALLLPEWALAATAIQNRGRGKDVMFSSEVQRPNKVRLVLSWALESGPPSCVVKIWIGSKTRHKFCKGHVSGYSIMSEALQDWKC